jgi:hypothetical protein
VTDLKTYFENTEGIGVLATADAEGKVDAAVYSRPHCMEDGTLAFIMRDRLTHRNLQSNPHAAYLFIEKGAGFQGMRLFLTRTREETDPDLIEKLRRRHDRPKDPEGVTIRFLVYFKLNKTLPLIGADSKTEMESP